jgi:uncharacterized damage-inducible protein DinB
VPIILSKNIIDLWILTHEQTVSLANNIPDNFDIKWAPFQELKSFGEICRHIVGSTYSILLRYFDYPIEIPNDIKNKQPMNKDRFLTELKITNESVMNLLTTLELKDLDKTFMDENKIKRTYLWGLWLLLDHEAHHRSQIKLYLKLKEVNTEN